MSLAGTGEEALAAAHAHPPDLVLLDLMLPGVDGLGLAIVKHIAQAHRGRAAVESGPNEGSVFSLHLPL